MTIWRLKSIKLIAQELSKYCKVGEIPHTIGHPCEQNIVPVVKLQGGKELLHHSGTIVLLDNHQLVQPHLLCDPQSITEVLILEQEIIINVLHWAHLGAHRCIYVLVDHLMLEAPKYALLLSLGIE
jgi:hypothetical protein